MKKLMIFSIILLPLLSLQSFAKEANSVFINISPADNFLETHKNKIDFQLKCGIKSTSSEKWYKGYPGSQTGNSLAFEAYNVLLCPSEDEAGDVRTVSGVNVKIYPKPTSTPIVKFLEFPEKMRNQTVKSRQICDIQFKSHNEIDFTCHLLKLR